MNGDNALNHRSTPPPPLTQLNHRHNINNNHTKKTNGYPSNGVIYDKCNKDFADMRKKSSDQQWLFGDASFMKWTGADVLAVLRYHSILCVFAASVLFFMGVEYTLRMIPPTSPPFDIGFVATVHLHRLLANHPALNTVLAALNTVFVGMQTGYILWTWLVEGRPRATIAALFMFTFRGILGYSTQLPLPEGFLGSGADFPVGNVSFFLFYSGHVAASVIASLDMKRMRRQELAFVFHALNILQVVRLLSTRGHYTIDLVVGVGAGILFDSLAGKYEEGSKKKTADGNGIITISTKHENGSHY